MSDWADSSTKSYISSFMMFIFLVWGSNCFGSLKNLKNRWKCIFLAWIYMGETGSYPQLESTEGTHTFSADIYGFTIEWGLFNFFGLRV